MMRPAVGQIWCRKSDGAVVSVTKVVNVASRRRPFFEVSWSGVSEVPRRRGRCGEDHWARRYQYVTSVEAGERDRRDPLFTAPDTRPACWSWPVLEDPPTAAVDQLQYLRDWQEGFCAICWDNSRPLVLDHDHLSRRARGYLCHDCNLHEGGRLDHAVMAAYRVWHPADMLGLDVVVDRQRPSDAPLLQVLGRRGYERHLLHPNHLSLLKELCGVPIGQRCWGRLAVDYVCRRISDLPPDVRALVEIDQGVLVRRAQCADKHSRNSRLFCLTCLLA